MKRILWVIFLMNFFAQSVAAHAIPDMNQSGSISITMRYKGETVSGGELTIYQVGNIHEDDGNYSFVLAEDFANASVSLENVQSAVAAENLSDFAKQQKLPGQTEPISKKGTVMFENLQPALYLIVQRKAAQGYYAVNPFFVSLPMLESGNYSYHVDAGPKVSPIPKPDNPEIPETGQSGWPIWVFGFSAAALIILRPWKKRT